SFQSSNPDPYKSFSQVLQNEKNGSYNDSLSNDNKNNKNKEMEITPVTPSIQAENNEASSSSNSSTDYQI
ncbi:16486_t:CDS:2, partial [Funneliformis geosporum]